eukprot:741392_1
MHMETTYLLFIAIYGVESFTYRGGTYTSFDYNTTTETCIVRECSTFNSWEDTYGECNEFTPITSALGQQYILNEDGDCMRHWSCDVSELRWFEGSAWPISGMCRCPKCSCDVEGDTQWVREEHNNGQISCTECTCDENLFFWWQCLGMRETVDDIHIVSADSGYNYGLVSQPTLSLARIYQRER